MRWSGARWFGASIGSGWLTCQPMRTRVFTRWGHLRTWCVIYFDRRLTHVRGASTGETRVVLPWFRLRGRLRCILDCLRLVLDVSIARFRCSPVFGDTGTSSS